MTEEQKFKTMQLLNFIAYTIDRKNIEQGQKLVYDNVLRFLKGNKLSFSRIECIEHEDIKDYIYCSMFTYIVDNQKVIRNRHKIFKTIISYYKMWR